MRRFKNCGYALVVGSLTIFAATSHAAEISYNSVDAFLDSAGSSDFLNLGEGLEFSIGVTGVTPDGNLNREPPPPITTATAYNPEVDIQREMTNRAFDGRPGIFGADFDPTADPDVLTSWDITLENGNDSVELSTPNRQSAEIMGHVRNLTLSGRADGPSASWDPPAGNQTVHFYQYELWDATKGEVMVGTTIPESVGDSTSISAEKILSDAGVENLDGNREYALRIFASRTDAAGRLESRSSNWIEWEATGGQAEGDVLRLETGSPVEASTQVDVPEESFNLIFDYRFETESGELSLSLGGESVGQTLRAPEEGLSNEFLTAFFEVDIESILGRDNQLLTLTLEGQTGSRVLLDNLRFGDIAIPGGDFSDGLSDWEVSGNGTALIAQVPLPPSFMLMLAGLIALIGLSGRRAQPAC